MLMSFILFVGIALSPQDSLTQPADTVTTAMVAEIGTITQRIDSVLRAAGDRPLSREAWLAQYPEDVFRDLTASPTAVAVITNAGLTPQVYARRVLLITRAWLYAALQKQMVAAGINVPDAALVQPADATFAESLPRTIAFVRVHDAEVTKSGILTPEMIEGIKHSQLNGSSRTDESAKPNAALEAAKHTPMVMQFTALDGRKVDLTKLRGNVVLIDFTAYTWCGACREQEPRIVDAYKKYHDKGFEIITITLENSPNDKPFVERYTRKQGVVWPVYFNGKGTIGNTFASQLGIWSVPHLLLLNREGLLVQEAIGNTAISELDPAIRKALGGESAPQPAAATASTSDTR